METFDGTVDRNQDLSPYRVRSLHRWRRIDDGNCSRWIAELEAAGAGRRRLQAKWLRDDGVLLSSTDCLQARARLICSICRSRRTGPGSRLHVMAARIVPSRAGPAVGTQLPVGRPLVESLWMAYNRLSPRKPWLSRAQLPARPACSHGYTIGLSLAPLNSLPICFNVATHVKNAHGEE